MKIVHRHCFHAGSCTFEHEIRRALLGMVHPQRAPTFALHPTIHGNSVIPIKTQFVDRMMAAGWLHEHDAPPSIKPYRYDLVKLVDANTVAVCEWETGNVSSSHRALNRLVKGFRDGIIHSATLIVPSTAMGRYLTDRVGNWNELQPYFGIYEDLLHSYKESGKIDDRHHFEILAFEYDVLMDTVPLLRKHHDGYAALK